MNSIEDVHVRDTRRWLERAVIGLNLCPFAKAAYVKDGVHYAVSGATDPDEVLAEFRAELDALAAIDPQVRETTLLIVPRCLQDFHAFNEFIGRAERALRKRRLEGTIQLASFHPRFQFAGTTEDDITNFTNRSPYPIVHLLRESSIDRAVEAFPHAEAIYETNMETLRRIGIEGWNALQVGPSA